MNENSPFHAASELWKRTDLTPEDVDCAQLYDGFTIIVFQWLEALGFCKLGEAGPFIEAGNTRLGGSLPVNTDGARATWDVDTAPTSASNRCASSGVSAVLDRCQMPRSPCGPTRWVRSRAPCS